MEEYFEDMKVTHYKSGIVQADDYYPFGAIASSYERIGEYENRFKFNGKELQTDLDLNWYDFGARMYDPEIGRFSTTDPLMEKYPAITPYAYVGNNPVIFTDPNGQELNVTFKGEGAEELYKKIINQVLNKQFEVSFKAVKGKENTFEVGIKATKGGGNIDKLSEGGKAFYNAFNEVIKSETVVNLDVFNGSDKVATGNYINNAIDVADMDQFAEFNNNLNEQTGATKQGKMIHETREQFNKALDNQEKGSNVNMNRNHLKAIDFEDAVNGTTRLGDYNPGRGSGVVEQFQRKNGTVVRLQIIGGINSTPRPVIIVKPYFKLK